MTEQEYIAQAIEADDRIYNLTLYLSHVQKNHPAVFDELEEHFEGMPGYAPRSEA